MKPERLDDLICMYLAGPLTAEMQAELDQALRENTAVGRRLAELSLQETLLIELKDIAEVSAAASEGASSQRTSAEVESAATVSRRAKPRRKSSLIRWGRRSDSGRRALTLIGVLGVAAAVLLVALHGQGWWEAAPADPANLQPKMPVATVDQAACTAWITAVRGGAIRTDGGSGTQLLEKGQSLPPGAVVETAADGELTLAYPDGSTLKIAAATRLQLDASGTAKGLMLESGGLTAEVTPQPSTAPMRLTTPFATATVVGTRFSLRTDARASRLTVTHGAVLLSRKSDQATVTVQGRGAGEFAEAGPGLALVVQAVSTEKRLFADTFNATEWPAAWVRLTPPGAADAVEIKQGTLVMHAANATPSWANWYAITQASHPLGRLHIQLRVRVPDTYESLATAVCIYDEKDSGRGDRENLELYFRGTALSLRRVAYPGDGSKNQNHPQTILCTERNGLCTAGAWIPVSIHIDAQNVTVTVNGKEIFNGPHGIDGLSRVRLGFYAGLKQTTSAYDVAFDDVLIEAETVVVDK